MLRRIVSVLDGSPLAETALPYVANLARVSGATLVLIQPTATGETLEFFDGDNPNLARYDPASPESPADPLVAQQVANDARVYLGSLARDLHGQGIKVETVVVPGDAAARSFGVSHSTLSGREPGRSSWCIQPWRSRVDRSRP